jgi:hypothetical protein
MHAAYPPAVFGASQVSFRSRKVGRKPHRSTRLSLSPCRQKTYGKSKRCPGTQRLKPSPPKKTKYILSIPLLTFFTPLAPIRLFPAKTHVRCSQIANISPCRRSEVARLAANSFV